MKFEPAPPNQFREFISTYFDRCREAVPEVEGIAGKWTFEDLIPGLSDFDTRLLVRDELTTEDWSRISLAVGRVHLEIALERPDWARILEHLPGINLCWSELLDPDGYYCEFRQWTFYDGPDTELDRCRELFSDGGWSDSDAFYHWKRISTYFDRYNRKIDPPINLGRYEGKYPLHSRIMHYLAPPVHSAVCLMDRKTTPGKLDAFRRAQEIFPQPGVMDRCLAAIDSHYECPELYSEPNLSHWENELYEYLSDVVGTALESGRLYAPKEKPSPESLRLMVQQLPRPGLHGAFFESLRFARLMQGRLWFFSREVPWFDSLPLIRIELRRIGKSFLEVPLELFAEIHWGVRLNWRDALLRFKGSLFSSSEIATIERFHRLASPELPDESLRGRAAEIAGMYPDFLACMGRLESGLQPVGD